MTNWCGSRSSRTQRLPEIHPVAGVCREYMRPKRGASRPCAGSAIAAPFWRLRAGVGPSPCRPVAGSRDELAHQVEEDVELVVVHPVSGALDRHHLGVAEMAHAAVLLGVGGPALAAVDQQGRTGDAPPQ